MQGRLAPCWCTLMPALPRQACEQLCSCDSCLCLLTACLFPDFSHCFPNAEKLPFQVFFSANSQEGGCRASLSSLKTALRQLQTVTLNTIVPTVWAESLRPPSHLSLHSWVRYLHKLNHSAIRVSEETHVKNYSWQLSFQVHIRTMRCITLTVKACTLTVFSGPRACRTCVMHA